MAAGTLVYEAGALVPQADVLVAVVAVAEPYLVLDLQDIIDAGHWAFGWSGDAINPSRGSVGSGLLPAPDFEVRVAAANVCTVAVGLYEPTAEGEPIDVSTYVSLLFTEMEGSNVLFLLDVGGAVTKPVSMPDSLEELRLVCRGGAVQVLGGDLVLAEVTAAELTAADAQLHLLRPYALAATDQIQVDGAYNRIDCLRAFWWNGTSAGGPSEFWADFLLAREEV